MRDMGAVQELDHTASLTKIAEFLRSCEGGVSRKTFDRRSRKSLRKLQAELSEREVRLWKHPETGYAVRSSHTTKAIIINPKERKFLLETYRQYPEHNNEIVPNFPDNMLASLREGHLGTVCKLWSFSETRKLGETSRKCLQRGAREELGVGLDIDQLEAKGRLNVINPVEEICDFHPSSTYFNVWTMEWQTWIEVHTHMLSSLFQRDHARDNGTIIHHDWYDLDLAA
jgi:hypothetical protein